MKKYLFTLAVASTLAIVSNAQELRTSYFQEDALYRHEMNPAFGNKKNYVAVPLLGNMHIMSRGNVGLENFIYDYQDPTGQYSSTTFLNSHVSAASFLNDLPDNTDIQGSLHIPVFSMGWSRGEHYTTIGVNLRTYTMFHAPKELFAFMKAGQTAASGTQYLIEDLSFLSESYAEISLGHSFPITPHIRVGATLKGLVGMGYIQGKIEQMRVEMSSDRWYIESQGYLDIAAKGAQWTYADNEYNTRGELITRENEIDDVDTDNISAPAGYGLAVDLGVIWETPVKNLTVSASLTDLGFINWSETIQGRQDPNNRFEFDGFSNFVLDEDHVEAGDVSLSDELDDLADDAKQALKFYDEGHTSKTRMLGTTAHIGAEYRMPFYNKLTTGLLLTGRFYGDYTNYEARLSANVKPVNWLQASLSGAASNFGGEIGWMLNFTPGCVNFFIGGDAIIGRLNKQFIPISNANADIALGMNITF